MGSQKHFTDKQNSDDSLKTSTTTTPQVSKNLWENTKRRHNEARESMRNLLDRYVKPHH